MLYRSCRVRNHALSRKKCESLRGYVLAHEDFGANPLLGSFSYSKGFGASLRVEGFTALLKRYPPLKPYFERILGWQGRWSRGIFNGLQNTFVPANAFYFNVLVLEEGATVANHIDATLSGFWGGKPRVLARQVDVIYLDDTPGELLIWPRLIPKTVSAKKADRVIATRLGRWVSFDGRVAHSVRCGDGMGVADVPGKKRVSLVLESYYLPRFLLDQIPLFEVKKRGQFAKVLAQTQSRNSKKEL